MRYEYPKIESTLQSLQFQSFMQIQAHAVLWRMGPFGILRNLASDDLKNPHLSSETKLSCTLD